VEPLLGDLGTSLPESELDDAISRGEQLDLETLTRDASSLLGAG
jgi:hypothetical protein